MWTRRPSPRRRGRVRDVVVIALELVIALDS